MLKVKKLNSSATGGSKAELQVGVQRVRRGNHQICATSTVSRRHGLQGSECQRY